MGEFDKVKCTPGTTEGGRVADGVQPTRARYSTRPQVQKHGGTEGCDACDGKGGAHLPRCRERFRQIWAKEDEERQAAGPLSPEVCTEPPEEEEDG